MQSRYSIFFILLIGLAFMSFRSSEWGFYAHRLINRMAVFTVPPPLFSFYRTDIGYIQEHAIDPDKRRYASSVEAVRHYLDLDHWKPNKLKPLKQPFTDVLLTYGLLNIKDINNGVEIEKYDGLKANSQHEYKEFTVDHYIQIRDSLSKHLFELLSEGTIEFDLDQHYRVNFKDQFSEHGILPYHLIWYQEQLKRAFVAGNQESILRISAELGHYISDAHVPLHTTTNYNGQFTGQDGIHSFWESRLPELFAQAEYDFFIGSAEYISDKEMYFWSMIDDAHSLVNQVLEKERLLKSSFSEDKQYCYEDRNGKSVRVPCKEYSRKYQEEMNGMVEDQMKKAIRAIGSCWYTAWVDAQKPNLSELKTESEELPIISIDVDTLLENDHILRNQN